MAKVKILAIPYKGGAPALTAVIAGEIPMSVNPLPEVVGQLDQTVRAIAVTTAQRQSAAEVVGQLDQTVRAIAVTTARSDAQRRCRMSRPSLSPACPAMTPRCGGAFSDPPAWRPNW